MDLLLQGLDSSVVDVEDDIFFTNSLLRSSHREAISIGSAQIIFKIPLPVQVGIQFHCFFFFF